jgi:peroxin-3
MSALLPPTTETMHHVLSQGGVTPASIQHATTTRAFRMLVDETHELLSSANFARVLDVALDRAVGVLFQGLEKNVFGESKLTNEGGPAGAGEVKLRLAGLLPALARWCHLALNALPNDLVDVRRLFNFQFLC